MKRCLHQACGSVWRTRQRHLQPPIPPQLADWLFDKGSLTRRLQQASGGRFRVQLLSQTWQRPLHNERLRLDMPPAQFALVRQVYLWCNEVPCVFARTIIPRVTLSGAERHLTVLGNRPLGAVLFADPTMQRDAMEVARLQPGEPLFAEAVRCLTQPPSHLWGRRSVFYLHQKPLLVNEIFLPGIADLRL